MARVVCLESKSQNGASQAVRLPKAFRFDTSTVLIKKVDNVVLLIPENHQWEMLFHSVDHFSDDFMSDREQPAIQKREEL